MPWAYRGYPHFAPNSGLEPETYALTVRRSAIELVRKVNSLYHRVQDVHLLYVMWLVEISVYQKGESPSSSGWSSEGENRALLSVTSTPCLVSPSFVVYSFTFAPNRPDTSPR